MPDEIEEVEQTGGEGGDGGEVRAPVDDSSKELADAAKELRGVVDGLKATPPPPAAGLTPAQRAELWGVFDPEKGRTDFMRKFFRMNPEATPQEQQEAKELFAYAHEGMVRQSLTGARNFDRIMMDEIDRKYGPILEYVQQAALRDRQERFYSTFESLRDSKYFNIINAVSQQLMNKRYENEGEYFKDLAERSAKAIQEIVPDFDLGKGKKTKQAGSAVRIPRSSVGSAAAARRGSSTDDDNQKNDIDSLE
jgi:hypothetical protein